MKNIILVIGLIIGLELSLYAQSFTNAIWERPLQTLIVDTDTLFINDTAGFNLFTGWFDLSNDTLSVLYESGTLFTCISSDTGVYEIDIALDTLRIDELADVCTGRRNQLDTSLFEFFAAQGTCTFTGGGDGTSFSDASNWSCGNVPDPSSDDIVIPTAFSVENDGNVDLAFDNDRSLTIRGSLEMNFKKIEFKTSGASLLVESTGTLTEVGELIFTSNSTGQIDFGASVDCENLKIDDGCALTIDARCVDVTDKLENLSDGGVYGTGCINYTGNPGDYTNDGSGGMFGCTDPDPGDCDLDGGTPLPIELLYFQAELAVNGVRLTWSTASEINNEYFLIERSTDFETIEVLARLPGQGNSNEINEYEYLDAIALDGVSYYRLKQIDYDGQYSYSDWKSISNQSILASEVFPNPATSFVCVKTSFNTTLDVRIFDAAGNEYTKIVKVNDDGELLRLDLTRLQPGFYLIKIEGQKYNFLKQ